MTQDDAGTKPDVLPEAANTVLALCWLLLLGGRWLLGPTLLATATLTPEQLTALDDTVLLKIYLLLLAVSLIVLGLRGARAASAPKTAAQNPADK